MRADAMLEIPQGVEGLEAGSKVSVRLLRPLAELEGGLVVTGSHDPLLDELAECVAGSESPETELLRKELTASLNRFLRKLPEKDRTVFLLRYYYAGTKEDIARKTGLSSNQVKYILQKVRKQLADTLKKEGLQ